MSDMSIKPQEIYKRKVEEYQELYAKTKKQLLSLSMLRLVIFLLIILAVYLLWGDYRWVWAAIFCGLMLFFVLVSKYTNKKEERDKSKILIAINKTEIKVLNRQFSSLPSGGDYKNPLHFFSQDIDLFGQHSFFQYLNRTALKGGEEMLAKLLTENSIANIETKQAAIAELANKTDFRQEFSAFAQLISGSKKEDTKSIYRKLETLKAHQFFTPKFSQIFANVFSLISILAIVSYFLSFISGITVALWLAIGLLITGFYIKRVNLLSGQVTEMQAVFRQYHQLLKLIENEEFSTELLQNFKSQILTEHKKASAILKAFSRSIDNLDQRNNLLFGFLGNGFLLWDMRQANKLENWMKQYLSKASHWFEVIYSIDAYNSLGNFAFNHPLYTYPQITDNNTIIKAQKAVHPLIVPKEAVTNDIRINKDNFFIITGANMAGKSTFLRTISLQIVMSNIGLPICAESCEYTPIKLITSMRTVDSLADDSSYFYAELSRLKFIIDQLKDEDYFIVLDEILKGTNSKDKAIGSQKFLEKLVRSHSSGIIATHDLSLCDVAQILPQVKNYYFDAQIIHDELFFDYKFKPGICQNMNASFLLRKMKITDD